VDDFTPPLMDREPKSIVVKRKEKIRK